MSYKTSLIESYNELDEENRLLSSRARSVEYYSTTDLISKYLFRNAKIFDIGCGVGIYSIFCAQRGAEVTAIDIVPKHIKRLEEIIHAKGIHMSAFVGNATDLSEFNDNYFDIVLCLGPLYHLNAKEKQTQCILESMRVSKPGGILFYSYISPFSVLPCVVRGDISRMSDDLIQLIIQDKKIDSDDEHCFWTDNWYYTPDDIEETLCGYGLEMIDHIASDGQSIAFQSVINAMNDKQFELWMKYHRLIYRERSLLGASNHGLIIAKKEGCS